ncbi:MAG: response regulator transcription factor [Saprospiraceae bacterium]
MKIKIILADDHHLVRQGFKALLSEMNEIEVIGEAADGLELIQLMKSGKKPDVILLDIEMPNMNGIEALKKITHEYFGSKIIMLTMLLDKEIIQEAVACGAKGFIFKNASLTVLIEAIKKVYTGENYFSSEVANILLNKKSGHPDHNQLKKLSDRELEVLKLIAEGFSSPEIGKRLFISARTVDTHRNNLIQKLEVNGIAGLVKFAILNKLV